MHAQRLYNNRQWPNPFVLKLTHVEPAFTPPQAETVRARFDAARKSAQLTGAVRKIAAAETLQVGFEYRDITGLDLTERQGSWKATPLAPRTSEGEFSAEVGGLTSGHSYEVRAVVKHPLLTLYGEEKSFRVP
jgi:alpha-L-fucosidase